MSRLPPSVAKLIPVMTALALICVGLGLFSSGRPSYECRETGIKMVPYFQNDDSSVLPPNSGRRVYRSTTVCVDAVSYAAPLNSNGDKWWFFGAGAVLLVGLSLVPMLAGRKSAT